MALSPGDRLGPYEISGTLGAGGMGEVYRARDTSLNRAVALKILPDAFASDPDRLARFTREAQTLAALNHPGIAQIYGIHAGQIRALVMEFVEGEDLAARLARGPLPLDDALAAAARIADAIEAAHEQGIVHRDLKPANIKLRPDGSVKVLDFGLAKATDAGGSSGPASSLSPTLTSPALMTGVGMLLGTAAYMSPEQAKGRPADKRSDIWAFGCVLFEMLTGKPLFAGETVTEVLASVLRDQPALGQLAPETPASVRRLLARCLERDPKQRLRDIGEARIAIAATLTGADESIPPPPNSQLPTTNNLQPRITNPRAWVPWAVAAAATAIAVVLAILWAPWRPAPASSPLRLSVDLGADASLVMDFGAAAVLSPDGTQLAFIAQRAADQMPQLYLRRLASLQAAAVSGTAGARDPFFSPNGEWIGFFADNKLKKVAIRGGAPITLADAVNPRGGTWSPDGGSIVFQPFNAAAAGAGSLMRIPAAGGTAAQLTSLADGEVTQRWPQVLPGGAVLFTSHTTTSVGYEGASIIVQPLPAGERKTLVRGGYYARYVPSGHLIYVHEGTLFAAPFDAGTLELTGPAAPVLEGVTTNASFGGAQFSIADNGTIVYVPGQILTRANPRARLMLVDRTGQSTPLHATPTSWYDLKFAPDGNRLAASIENNQGIGLWTLDTARDALSRLTFNDGQLAIAPTWTPDGRRIAYVAGIAIGDIHWLRADGGGTPQQLTRRSTTKSGLAFHPDGRQLVYSEYNAQSKTVYDLMVLPIEGNETDGWKAGQPTPFLATPAIERYPAFSPDGRWIAYASDETGRSEVYVRPFPGPGGKWQISTDGGSFPAWSRTRPEIVYSGPASQIMTAAYAVNGDAFVAERPRPWPGAVTAPLWTLHPDGNTIAATPSIAPAFVKQDKVVMFLDFFDEVRLRAQ